MIRSDSTEADEAGGGLAGMRRVIALVAALVASAGCFALVPGDTLGVSLVQSTMLSAVALIAVAVAHPRVLGAPHDGACRGLRAWTGYVLAVALAAGIATCVLPSADQVLPGGLLRVAQVVALCLLTGVFEEGLFRVLAVDAFALAFGGGRNGLLKAAFASSVLFGLLHVSAGDAHLANDAVAGAQMALKPVQAGLFGFFMVAMYVDLRNLWVLGGVHAAFNLLSMGPLLLAGGMQQTYVTGSPFDLELLLATTVLLVPPAVYAFVRLRKERASQLF